MTSIYEKPKALLLQWDAELVHVRCPYCSQLDIQKFIGYEPHSWDSQCGAGRYSIEFPVDGSWELDKANEKYINPSAYGTPPIHGSVGKAETMADAILERPSGLEPIGARSDLRRALSPVQCLEGEYWVKKALDLSDSIQYLWPDGKDHSSHAEKQLIAKFVDLHIWLPEEIHLDKDLRRDIDQINMKYWWLRSSSPAVRTADQLEKEIAMSQEMDPSSADIDVASRQQQLAELRCHPDVQTYEEHKIRLEQRQQDIKRQQNRLDLSKIQPAKGVKEAVIQIASPAYEICDGCRQFVAAVNEVLGTRIELREHHGI